MDKRNLTADMSRPMQLTHELVVWPAVHGKDVFYKIFQTGNHTEPVKVTRYSELHVLQKALKREAPAFRATLPAKTLRRQTSPEFVERRRREIEAYLQLCLANEYVVNADAWRIFLSDSVFRPAPDSNARVSASGTSVSQTVFVTSKQRRDFLFTSKQRRFRDGQIKQHSIHVASHAADA